MNTVRYLWGRMGFFAAKRTPVSGWAGRRRLAKLQEGLNSAEHAAFTKQLNRLTIVESGEAS